MSLVGGETQGGIRPEPGIEPLPGYRLIERLGAGGFGEVWKAEAPGGLQVALKFVLLRGDAGAAELRALEIFRGIRHPNLLALFGAWQVQGSLVIGMELADRTLWNRFEEARASGLAGIPHDELFEAVAEAAKGIDYLNAYRHTIGGRERVGVQHRDVKPQNILLVGGGVKVADFGLARLLDGSATGHTGSLSLAYAAPEFFRRQTSSRSDQYSLAATYCHLRGGKTPFRGSAAAVMAGHLHQPPDLSALAAEERPAVARALAKDPKERWPDCRSFVTALRAAGSEPVTQRDATDLSGKPTEAADAKSPEECSNPGSTRRSRVSTTAAVGASIALTLALGLGLWARGFPRATGFGGAGVPRAKQEVAPDGPDRSGPPPSTGDATRGGAHDAETGTTRGGAAELSEEGDAHFDAGRFNDAIDSYTQAIDREPGESKLYFNRGNAHFAEAQTASSNGRTQAAQATFRRALADYDKAIELGPDDADFRTNRGNTLSMLGDLDRAIADYDEAIRLAQDDPKPYVGRGKAYQKQGDQNRAAADFETADRLRAEAAESR
jgi:hypothetical protein